MMGDQLRTPLKPSLLYCRRARGFRGPQLNPYEAETPPSLTAVHLIVVRGYRRVELAKKKGRNVEKKEGEKQNLQHKKITYPKSVKSICKFVKLV